LNQHLWELKNVLNSVTKSGTVKRVVLTASIVSIASGSHRKPGNAPFTEEDWNPQDNIKNDPYPYSKKLAEEKAWEMEKAQDVWKLVTIHPGFVMGPVLSSRSNDGSIGFIKQFLNGSMVVAPNLGASFVDVRDVAKAHILGMRSETTGRYLCVENSYYFPDVGNMLKPKYGHKYKLPKYTLPDFLAKLIVPLVTEFSWQYLSENLSSLTLFSNAKIKRDLGMEFIPLSQSIVEMVDSLIEKKVIS